MSTEPQGRPALRRRSFLSQSTAAASALAFPLVGGAQPRAVKVGILHP
ncbi:MAG: twin-arginine translocation signal domain-containing protein, partial [Pseudomonadota bacterium]